MKHIAPQLEFDFSAPVPRPKSPLRMDEQGETPRPAPEPEKPRRQSAAKRKDWKVDCTSPTICPNRWAGCPTASLCHGCRFFSNSRGPAFYEPKGGSKPSLLIVEAAVRYWEDAIVNGVEDKEGILIPFHVGDLWRPNLELETGRFVGWPQGVTASIHYKVCDMGEYWLADPAGRRLAKWKGAYVPNDLLCVGDDGFGDYIILEVNENGAVQDWRKPRLDWSEWDRLNP